MPSVYPGAIDSTTTFPTDLKSETDSGSGTPRTGTAAFLSDLLNNLDDAVRKIELELGITPSAAAADVATRLQLVSYLTSGTINPIVGRYYDGAFYGAAATGTIASLIGTAYVVPFRPGRRISIDRIGVNQTAGATAGNIKFAIYESDPVTGIPTTQLLAPIAIASAIGAGGREATINVQLEAGKLYWLGINQDQAFTYSTVPDTAAIPFGGLGTVVTGIAYVKRLQRTIAFATGFASPWAFVATDLNTSTAISIRVRVATAG